MKIPMTPEERAAYAIAESAYINAAASLKEHFQRNDHNTKLLILGAAESSGVDLHKPTMKSLAEAITYLATSAHAAIINDINDIEEIKSIERKLVDAIDAEIRHDYRTEIIASARLHIDALSTDDLSERMTDIGHILATVRDHARIRRLDVDAMMGEVYGYFLTKFCK